MPASNHSSPLTDEEFAAICDELNINQPFAVAVSGGRDSMVLVRLAVSFAKLRGLKIKAYTLDHDLRERSAGEAEVVAEWCRNIGVDHQILKWCGEKPTAGVQEAARHARYFFLARAATHDGFAAILTGHNADDLVETHLMRRARSDAPAGLAAMRAARKIAPAAGAPISLFRPFLTISRDQITATATARGQAFIDDPSNEDQSFERVRVRENLRAAGDEEKARLIDAANQARVAADELWANELKIFKKIGGYFTAWGGASVDGRLFGEVPVELAAGMLRRLVRAVSGEAYLPAADAAARAGDEIRRGKSATLNGAMVCVRKARIWIYREPAALLGRAGVAPILAQNLPPNRPLLWDGRFVIENAELPETLAVSPIGTISELARDLPFYDPREALQTIPGIFDEATLIASPGLLSHSRKGINIRALAEERFSTEIMRFSEV